jgi:hypothetical protein
VLWFEGRSQLALRLRLDLDINARQLGAQEAIRNGLVD